MTTPTDLPTDDQQDQKNASLAHLQQLHELARDHYPSFTTGSFDPPIPDIPNDLTEPLPFAHKYPDLSDGALDLTSQIDEIDDSLPNPRLSATVNSDLEALLNSTSEYVGRVALQPDKYIASTFQGASDALREASQHLAGVYPPSKDLTDLSNSFREAAETAHELHAHALSITPAEPYYQPDLQTTLAPASETPIAPPTPEHRPTPDPRTIEASDQMYSAYKALNNAIAAIDKTGISQDQLNPDALKRATTEIGRTYSEDPALPQNLVAHTDKLAQAFIAVNDLSNKVEAIDIPITDFNAIYAPLMQANLDIARTFAEIEAKYGTQYSLENNAIVLQQPSETPVQLLNAVTIATESGSGLSHVQSLRESITTDPARSTNPEAQLTQHDLNMDAARSYIQSLSHTPEVSISAALPSPADLTPQVGVDSPAQNLPEVSHGHSIDRGGYSI